MMSSEDHGLDEVILQVFEEHEASFHFPVATQKEARAFVKALHGKGLSYDCLLQEIKELEQNFSAWRKGISRPGIGNRVIERINRPLQEMLHSDGEDEDPDLFDQLSTDSEDVETDHNGIEVGLKNGENRLTAGSKSNVQQTGNGVDSLKHVKDDTSSNSNTVTATIKNDCKSLGNSKVEVCDKAIDVTKDLSGKSEAGKDNEIQKDVPQGQTKQGSHITENETAVGSSGKSLELIEKKQETVTENKQAVAEKKQETTTEKKQAVSEIKQEAVADKKQMVADNKIVEVSEKKQETVPEKKQEAVLEKKQIVPEKKQETVAEKKQEAVTEKKQETIPEKKQGAVREKKQEAVPEKKQEAVPEKKQIVPEKKQETVAEKKQEAVPEKKEAVTEKKQEAVHEKKQEAVPEKKQEAVTENKQETVAEKKQEAVPEKKQEAVTEKKQETIPEKKQGAVPGKQQEAVPEKKQETVAEKKQEAVREKKQEAVPEKKQEAVPEKKHEAVLEKKKEAVLEKKQEAVSEKKQETVTEQKQMVAENKQVIEVNKVVEVAEEKQEAVTEKKQGVVTGIKQEMVAEEKRIAALTKHQKSDQPVDGKTNEVGLKSDVTLVKEEVQDQRANKKISGESVTGEKYESECQKKEVSGIAAQCKSEPPSELLKRGEDTSKETPSTSDTSEIKFIDEEISVTESVVSCEILSQNENSKIDSNILDHRGINTLTEPLNQAHLPAKENTGASVLVVSSGAGVDSQKMKLESNPSTTDGRCQIKSNDVLESYDSDCDAELNHDAKCGATSTGDNPAMTCSKPRVTNESQVDDSAGYVYVFTDSSAEKGEFRVKVGASRFPHKKLQQSLLFNIDMKLVSAVQVSDRRKALDAVHQKLNAFSIPKTVGWFSGPLENILNVLMAVTKDYPHRD